MPSSRYELQLLGALFAAIALQAATRAAPGYNGYAREVNQGRSALADHKWSIAMVHFRNALAWNDKGLEALVGLGDLYLAVGQPAHADEEFQAALRLKPNSSAARQGIRESQKPETAENANRSLRVLLESEPQNAEAHAMLAACLLDRDRVDEARTEATLSMNLDKKCAIAYCVLGTIAANDHRDEEARELLDRAIRDNSAYDGPLLILGDLDMRRKHYAGAAASFRRFVRIAPECVIGHKKLMEALSALGDSRGAEREKVVIGRLENTSGR